MSRGVDAIVASQSRFRAAVAVIVDPGADQRPTATHALGLNMRVFLADARLYQRPHEAARRSARGRGDNGANQGGNQPPARYNRANSRDGQHTESCQQAAPPPTTPPSFVPAPASLPASWRRATPPLV